MSNVKRLQFETTIEAPTAVVWKTMLGAETFPRWTSVFVEGSYSEGSWSQGSRPNEFISIRHLGHIVGGVEDTGSEAVRAWAPAFDNYTFSPVPEGTRIVVDQDVTSEFEDYMKATWPKALESLKRLCEAEAVT